MKVNYKLVNEKRLIRKLLALKKAHRKKIVRQASRASSRQLHRKTKEAAPEETGLLKASIKLRSAKRSRVRVGHNVIIRKIDMSKGYGKRLRRKAMKRGNEIAKNYNWEIFYAGFVELGTKKIKATHFMKRTAERYGPIAQKRFMKRVAVALTRAAQQQQ